MISPTRRTAQSFSTKEWVPSLLTFHQRGGEVELLLRAAVSVVDLAGDDDLGRAGTLVAADHHELLAGEEIEPVLGIDPIDRLAVFGLVLVQGELDRDVG